MARERTLLERLADPSTDEARTTTYSAGALADSVRRHLQRMLNTRQGQVPAQPDYGMVDITDCAESLPDVLEAVRRAIKTSIERYEPRLRRVRIASLPSPDSLTLRFAVTGELETGRERVPVSFDTTIDPVRGAAVIVGRDAAGRAAGAK